MPPVLFLSFLLPAVKLQLLFRVPLFAGACFSFQLLFLPLQLQCLLCLCPNSGLLQLTVDLPLHSFGIDFSLHGYFGLDWGTKFQLVPILQQKLIDLIVFGL